MDKDLLNGLILDFLQHDMNEKQRADIESKIFEFAKQSETHAQAVAKIILQNYKQFPLLQEAVCTLRLLSHLGPTVSQCSSTALSILDKINSNGRLSQYITCCKYVAKFLKFSEIKTPHPISLFAVLRYQKSENSELEVQADAFASSLFKLPNTKDFIKSFAFKVGSGFTSILPKEIFINKVLPSIQKQFIRNGVNFATIATAITPKFDLPVTESSAPYHILKSLMTEQGEKAKELLATFKASVPSFEASSLLTTAITFYKKVSNIDAKMNISSAISSISLASITDDGIFNSLFELAKSRDKEEIRLNIMSSLPTNPAKTFDFVMNELEFTVKTAGIISHTVSNLDKASAEAQKAKIQTLISKLSIEPCCIISIFQKLGFNEFITNESLELLSQPSAYQTDRFECLVRAGKYELAFEIFCQAPNQILPLFNSLPIENLNSFLLALIHSPNPLVTDSVLEKMTYTLLRMKHLIDQTVIALICPAKATDKDASALFEIMPFHPHLVNKSLAHIGFTDIQGQYIKNTIKKYQEDPLKDEETSLLICKEEIDENHPSAEQLMSAKEELNHPSVQSNIPKLKKQIEKLTEKVKAAQIELKSKLNQEKINPILNVIHLLMAHTLSHCNVSNYITSPISYLLQIALNPVFEEPIFDLIYQIVKRINSYSTTPKLITNIIKKSITEDGLDHLDQFELNSLRPKKLTDTILHLISHILPVLLDNNHSHIADSFSEVSAITPQTNAQVLLNYYIANSQSSEKVFNFAVALCQNRDIKDLPTIFDYLLDWRENVRYCALLCLISSNHESLKPLSPHLFCVIATLAIEHEEAGQLLAEFETGFDYDELIKTFEELFKLDSHDEKLMNHIGQAFGFLNSDDPANAQHATTYLINLFENNSEKCESYEADKRRKIRITASGGILAIKPIYPSAVDFVCFTGLKDSSEIIRDNMVEVIESYIENFEGDMLDNLFDQLFVSINLPPVNSPPNLNLRSSVIPLLQELSIKEPKYQDQFLDAIQKYNIRAPREDIRTKSTKALSAVAKKLGKDKIMQRIENLVQTRETMDTIEKCIGFGYSYSAYLFALGISGIKTVKPFDFTTELSKSKKETDKIICCYIFNGLSFQFGKLLEPSLQFIIEPLLTCYSGSDELIEAADAASQSIVKNLTHACVERVLPAALKKAEDDNNWRTQVAAIRFVDAVLKSNSKNVSRFIPQIVRSLSQSMKSVNSNVREKAASTLRLIKSSISNEAVANDFEFLFAAIIDPSKLEIALNKIMSFNLNEKLDENSLSLIVPLIITGCHSPNLQTKTDSTRIISHLPEISEKGAISVFGDELTEPLFQCISDSSPNVRTIAAVSLSAIVTCFPDEKYYSILNRLLKEMPEKQTFSERQGNAQAIASLIKTRGLDELKQQLETFIDQANHATEIPVREGYVSLLGFLSLFFGEDFHFAYEKTIKAVLDACADSNDVIRTVGLRSVSLITKTFAEKHPELIIEPFFACAMKENWRQRLCSVNFIKAFVLTITGTTEADDKGIRNIGEILGKLEAALSKEKLYPVLMTLFILSADPVPIVSSEAQSVWRQVIPNTGGFLRQTTDIFLDRLSEFVKSRHEVVRHVGASAMAFGVKKLKTMFLNKCLDQVDHIVQEEDIDGDHGCITCLNMMDDYMNVEEKLRACKMLAPFLSSPFTQIRQAALDTFVKMRKSLGDEGDRLICSDLIQYVVKKAMNGEPVDNLSGLLKNLGQHSIIQMTYLLQERPLTPARPDLPSRATVVENLVQAAGNALKPVIESFTERLISMTANAPCAEDSKISLEMAAAFVKNIRIKHLQQAATKLVENMRSQTPQSRQASVKITKILLERYGDEFNEVIGSCVRGAIYLLDDPLQDIQDSAIELLKSVGSRISQSNIAPLIAQLDQDFTSLITVSKVRAFERPSGFESFELIIEHAFDALDGDCVRHATSILALVVPLLKYPPISTRKILARCVYALQGYSDSSIQLCILESTRALCKKVTNETQMLVNSLPTAYLRLFRTSDSKLLSSASEALFEISTLISEPINIVRLFLYIIRRQDVRVGSAVVSGLKKTIERLSELSEKECDEVMLAIFPLLKSKSLQMRDLTAQTIATALLSTPVQKLIDTIVGEKLFKMDDPSSVHSAMICINTILTSHKKDAALGIAKYVEQKIPDFNAIPDEYVRAAIPPLTVSLVLIEPRLITGLLEMLLGLFKEQNRVEQQVKICQELQRLRVLKSSLWINEKQMVLTTMIDAKINAPPAVQSAAASTLFDMFRLDEMDEDELKSLAKSANIPEATPELFQSIMEEVEIDRRNQRIRLNK